MIKKNSKASRRPLRRRRLTKQEHDYLEAQYIKSPIWDTEKTRAIAEHMNLKRIKIYKWHYCRKQKDKVQDNEEAKDQRRSIE